jgi:hypothetical protein
VSTAKPYVISIIVKSTEVSGRCLAISHRIVTPYPSG